MIGGIKTAIFLFTLSYLTGCNSNASIRNESDNGTTNIKELPVSEEIKEKTLQGSDYINWVRNPENGLVKEKVIDELKFKIQFKPYEYIACMNEHTDQLADTVLKKAIKELNGMQFYDLKISLNDNEGEILKAGLKSREDYDKRVKYFSFEMQQDIQLVDGTDTLPCTMYHYERAYDATPVTTILVGFQADAKNAAKTKTLLIYDRTFNKGLLKFRFTENRLNTLPKLLTL
jgi:hypothetical protein